MTLKFSSPLFPRVECKLFTIFLTAPKEHFVHTICDNKSCNIFLISLENMSSFFPLNESKRQNLLSFTRITNLTNEFILLTHISPLSLNYLCLDFMFQYTLTIASAIHENK